MPHLGATVGPSPSGKSAGSCAPEVAVGKAMLPAVDLGAYLSVFACLGSDEALVGGTVAAEQHVGGRGGAAQGERDAAGGERIDCECGIADRDPVAAGTGAQLVAGA